MDSLLFSQRLKIERAVDAKKGQMIKDNPQYLKTTDLALTIIAMDSLKLFNKDEVRKLKELK